MELSDINESFVKRAGAAPDDRPTLVISGGSRGLGRALVLHLANSYNVSFGWRASRSEAESLLDEVRSHGGWALPYQLDVTQPVEVDQWAGVVGARFGPASVVIHTTGHFSMTPLGKMNVATWRAEMDSTVNAGFYLWKAFSDQLLSPGRGRLIFIGDSAAEHLRARKQSTGYYVGKHGLVLLARTIASENQGTALTCNVVSPGVLPNSVDLHEPDMRVNVGFDEIAAVIDFLLSEAGDAVSGSNIVASRGWNV